MMSTTNKRSKSVKGLKFLQGQKQIAERESAGYNPDNIQLTHKRCDICRLNHIKPENEELFKKKYWVKYCRNCYKKNGYLATSCIQCGKHTFSAPKKPYYDFAEHSDEMWAIHNEVIKKGRYCHDHHKEEKTWTYPDWTARESAHRECIWNDAVPGPHLHDREQIPIYMSCSKCQDYLGSIEYENADILGSMCLVCFREKLKTMSKVEKNALLKKYQNFAKVHATAQEEVELCKTGSASSDDLERRMQDELHSDYTPHVISDWKFYQKQYDVWYYPTQQTKHDVLKEFQEKKFHQQNNHPAFEGLRKQIRKKVDGGNS